MTVAVLHGDCLEKMAALSPLSVDAVVTDPPYELGFMSNQWDASGIAYKIELWREVLRLCKPGSFLIAFGATRTYHRMACAVEDAGFEIRDQIQWIYSGMPKHKSLLKPAHEPILLARKPGPGSLNIDACRLPIDENERAVIDKRSGAGFNKKIYGNGMGRESGRFKSHNGGRWPANIIHDGCLPDHYARFFYCPKANKKERNGSHHPTIKPLALMRWLIRLVATKGGTVLDPFAGTGTTGEAADQEGMNAILIESENDYLPDIHKRLSRCSESRQQGHEHSHSPLT